MLQSDSWEPQPVMIFSVELFYGSITKKNLEKNLNGLHTTWIRLYFFKNLPYQQPYYFQIIANGINYLYHLANIYKLRNLVFYLWFLFFVYWDIGTYTVLNPILKFYIFSSYPRVCLIKVQNHHSYKNWWFFKIRPKNCQFFFSNEQFL